MMEVGHTRALLLGFIWTQVIGDDCVYKECLCTGNMIMCVNTGLKEVPQKGQQEPNLAVLDMEMNSITRIPAGILPFNLTDINWTGNPITTIEDSAFDESANTLESLTFGGALFTRIPDAFRRLYTLKSFTIHDTNIIDWNTEAMIHIGESLETLYVENCSVVSWPAWIQNLTHLTELALSSGSVSSIPDGTFDKVADKLTSLTLSNNSLYSVPKALSKLSTLTELYLQENKISDVTWLPRYSNLTILSLKNNIIYDADQLSKTLLPYAFCLNEFYIDHNELTVIPNISYFFNLISLDFANNLISEANSGMLPPYLFTLLLQYNLFSKIPPVMMSISTITDMVLFSNYITEIDGADIPNWIIEADLSLNLITELTDSSFPQQSMLQFLSLNRNPISKISDQAFKNTPQLIEISFQYTKLTRVPLPLSSAISLVTVDFTGTVDLICTCVEKSFGKWILSLPVKTITGDCGEMSVYNFFATLSQDCPEQ